MRGGVLIIDKPADLSSAQVVGKVKKLLGARKVGHAGTLDPFATGVLVCLINQATRLAQFFLTGMKQYEAELCLGVETDTQDPTGQVINQRTVPTFSESDLTQVFERFSGVIEQVPPAYSALKHNGVALYKLARNGRPIQKPARRVRIEAIQIRSVSLPKVRFTVTCSAGTYIRTLCADIGQVLDCGGHLSALRRTMSSGFGIGEAVNLKMLSDWAENPQTPVVLIPPGDALRGMPALVASRATAAKIQCGGVIRVRDFTDLPPDATVTMNGDKGAYFKVLDHNGDLMAVVSTPLQGDQMTYCGVYV